MSFPGYGDPGRRASLRQTSRPEIGGALQRGSVTGRRQTSGGAPFASSIQSGRSVARLRAARANPSEGRSRTYGVLRPVLGGVCTSLSA
jgi:hypothetical protein